ncbi:hypothetical protein MSP7336_01506 [Mycobacterium shimoidei]|uniref:Uncharacterized protein n=2 Tax=Mycobacterium shimoidei TaxID=29313 RepID=A0A375YWM9_MYCSH|nr:hypothetical protein MSP7336_01506 [Mycobacterium shimoidei]
MRTVTLRLLAPAIMVIAVIAGIGVSGCDASETDESLVVQQGSRALAHFTVRQLQGLPQVEITTPQSRGAKVQKGPTVRSVLDAAHADGVIVVRVDGRDPAQTLSAAELTNDVILDITKRHTLKLTGANLTLDRWVRDVTALVVNP